MPTPHLTKSRYMQGLQCLKSLWLSVHEPDQKAELDEVQERIFEIGQRVGRIAHRLFPGGRLIAEDHLHIGQALASTRGAVGEGAPAIFEATVSHRNVVCRADVLKRVRGESGTCTR